MNRTLALCVASILMFCLAACTNTIKSEVDEQLFLKAWYYDFSQTGLFSDSTKELYVAEGQPLPPARGRTGMKFAANGQYTYIGIAPADGELLFNGSWKWTGVKTFRVRREAKTFQGASWEAEEKNYEVLSLSETELLLRQLP